MSNDDFLDGTRRGERQRHLKPGVTDTTMIADAIHKLEGDARAYLLGQGQKTGHEYMTVLDLHTGKRLAQGTSHDPGRVYIPDELTRQADDPDRRIAYHHNHPESCSLSPSDLAIMGKRPGLFRVVAYGHDGSWFRAERRDLRNLEILLDVVRIELRHQGQWAAQRRLSLRGLEAHLTNLALHRAGLIDYDFALDQNRERFCKREQAALDQIVIALTTRIQQMRSSL